MNIEIFQVKYLEFIFQNIWHYIGFIIILLIVTNYLRKLLSPLGNFFGAKAKEIKENYRNLDKKDKLAGTIKKLKPDFLDKIKENEE